VLILLVYFPNGEGAMGNLWHMIWVILAAILAGVSMVKVDPLGLRSKPAVPVVLASDAHVVLTPDVPVPAADGHVRPAPVVPAEVADGEAVPVERQTTG